MLQRRILIIFFAVLLSMLSMVASFMTAYYLSWLRATHIEKSRLSDITARLITRIILTYQDAQHTLFQINSQTDISPCSPQHIQLMRNKVLNSEAVDEIGYVRNGMQQCGTWGIQNPPRLLKFSDDVTTRDGIKISFDMRSTVSPKKRMLSLRYGNYNVLINPIRLSNIILDNNVKVALFAVDGTLVSSTDNVDLNFIKNYFFNKIKPTSDKFIISAIHSKNFIAIAMEPKSNFYDTLTAQEYLLLPLGLLMTLPMIALIIYSSKRRLSIASELEYALDKNKLTVYYQPLIELKTGKCIGAEALIRWFPSQNESIPPDFFITVAEKAGFIAKITKFVITTVIKDMRALLVANKNMHISINLNVHDLEDQNTLKFLETAIEYSGISHDQIWLEITERQLIQIDKIIPLIKYIRTQGYKFATDDFGTGYSNLANLKNMTLDLIKIDQSFIETIGINSVTSSITGHIINIAKELNLKIVAEGVKTASQRDYLIERQVEYGQGSLYSSALSYQEFLSYYKCHLKT